MSAIARTISGRLGTCILISLVASIPAVAQEDSMEFRVNPTYNPGQNPEVIAIHLPQVIFKTDSLFPSDSTLAEREATVMVNVLVDTAGFIHDMQVWKSTDERFNIYALKYVKGNTFTFTETVRQIIRASKVKKKWISIPVEFSQ